jgi:peptidoglycan/LPS O-acetylase OafA/YrhL
MIKTTVISKSGKFEELESIRGIAAMLVVLVHIPNWNSYIFDISIFRNSYLMVELFFVISGFVIYNSYANNIKTRNDFFRFQFLRFGRLYPVHLLFLLLFVFVEFAKYILSYYYGLQSPNSIPFKINDFSSFVSHLFLVQSLGIKEEVGSFNAPSWSISAEFYTYIIFALIVLKLFRWKIIMFTFLMILCYFLLYCPIFLRFNYFFVCLIGFSSGALVCEIASKRFFHLSGSAPLISMAVLIFFLTQYPIGKYYPFIFPISAVFVYSLIVSKDGFIKRFLRLGLFLRLGEISYSIYMCHFLIIWIINQFIRVILKCPESVIDGKSFPQLTITQTIIAYIIVISVTLLTSMFTYKFVEKPFRERSRAFALLKMRN